METNTWVIYRLVQIVNKVHYCTKPYRLKTLSYSFNSVSITKHHSYLVDCFVIYQFTKQVS